MAEATAGAGGRSVLVTGVSRYLGARLARELAERPDVRRVVGIDGVQPRHDLGEAEFVRADLRNPLLGRVLQQAGVDVVVHLSVSAESGAGGQARASQKEHNVIGTMQLLAAAQARPTLRRLVLKSTAALYGSSPRDPAYLTEDAPAWEAAQGFARDALEVEGYVRGLARRRPDVTTCVLRMAHVVGPHVVGRMTEYLRGRLVPAPLGFDARLQVLHEDDAAAALLLAATGDAGGVVNVAADGVVGLGQAVRLTGGLALPVPTKAGRLVSGIGRRTRLWDLGREQIDYLTWGRVLDTGRMRADLGLEPRHTTREALEDFAASLPVGRTSGAAHLARRLAERVAPGEGP